MRVFRNLCLGTVNLVIYEVEPKFEMYKTNHQENENQEEVKAVEEKREGLSNQ